jgi:hypothetical protein
MERERIMGEKMRQEAKDKRSSEDRKNQKKRSVIDLAGSKLNLDIEQGGITTQNGTNINGAGKNATHRLEESVDSGSGDQDNDQTINRNTLGPAEGAEMTVLQSQNGPNQATNAGGQQFHRADLFYASIDVRDAQQASANTDINSGGVAPTTAAQGNINVNHSTEKSGNGSAQPSKGSFALPKNQI